MRKSRTPYRPARPHRHEPEEVAGQAELRAVAKDGRLSQRRQHYPFNRAVPDMFPKDRVPLEGVDVRADAGQVPGSSNELMGDLPNCSNAAEQILIALLIVPPVKRKKGQAVTPTPCWAGSPQVTARCTELPRGTADWPSRPHRRRSGKSRSLAAGSIPGR